MNTQLIVVECATDWVPFYPAENLVEAKEFLASDPSPDELSLVINLCRDYKYLGNGYYCSLLAEARGDRVIPSVRTINELSKRRMYSLCLNELEKGLHQSGAALDNVEQDTLILQIFFGITQVDGLQHLARQIFDLFPAPALEVSFRQVNRTWAVEQVRTLSIHQLDEDGLNAFASELDHFSKRVWRQPRRRKKYSCDLAMLVDPKEAMPPSNQRALDKFVRAGRRLNINVELIGKQDYPRLTEYDALFIRTTTSVDHYTYQFAQKAEFMNIPVIDDTGSILRCANKVYLTELLAENSILTPKTYILYKDDPVATDRAVSELGFPMVLKIPDGSFSRGIVKVNTEAELAQAVKKLFKTSVLILAQEFMYTDSDWRIGVLGGRPLFACKYFMSKGHWQIYNHAASGKECSGASSTVAIEQTPAACVKTAVKATGLIGKGLYGVDIKQSGDQFYVIEINDNPNIDSGIEDLHLKGALYHQVMQHFYDEIKRL